MRRPRPSLLAAFLAAWPVLGTTPALAAPPRGGASFGPEKPGESSHRPAAESGLTPEAALARATAFYESGQYVECSGAFAALLDDESLARGLAFRSREQARVYRAACLIAQGKTAAADDQFRAAIRESPQMERPNAIVFPQPVIERFFVVRSQLLEEIRRSEEERAERQRQIAAETRSRAAAERLRVAKLERLAAEETVVVTNRRWIASVPFGVGQFQNRDVALGTLFLASEAILLGTAVTAVSIELSLNSQANGGAQFSKNPDLASVQALNQNLRTADRIALYSTSALLAIAVGGVLQANLAFVPEFSGGVRARRPSKGTFSPGLLPTAAPTSGGAEFGVMGRF